MRFKILLFLLCLSVTSVARAQTPPAAPTDVVVYAPNQGQVHMSWKDNATDETAYKVEIDNDPGAGETWAAVTTLVPDSEVVRVAAPSTAEQEVRYRVAADKSGTLSEWVVGSVLKPAGALSVAGNIEGAEARAGIPFSFQIAVSSTGTFTYIASGLPAGVSVNATTGLVSGTIATEGVYRCFVGVQFDGTKKFEQVKFIRVLPAPSTPVVVNTAFTIPALDVDELVSFNIAGMFNDPVRDSGVLISTLGESVILALHDKATPKTVKNFLGYVTRGDYASSYLHRSDSGFIIQGGGAKPAFPGASPTNWTNISTQPAVPNEPGLSNRRRTISMAKFGGQPDSATSEWFISTGTNNPAILNGQNGGFSAFGEVVGEVGMNIVDQLNSLPVANYGSVITGTTGVELSEVPVLQFPAPSTPAANSLVLITSITPVEPVEITVAAITPSSILNAAVFGTELYVQSAGPSGIATLTLRATNVDGNFVDFPVRVEVIDTNSPGIAITSLKGKGGSSLLVKARAADDNQLGSWRYRINKGAWKRGGSIKGTFAKFSKVVSGFRSGKNVLELQAFDKKGNSSGILTQRFTLN